MEFETLYKLTLAIAPHAHWLIFGSILLAGLNIPISLDGVMLITALLAAHIMPERAVLFFFAAYCGCIGAAWISYYLGRRFGPLLKKWRLFSKVLSDENLEKTKSFYGRYGFWALVVGRFIPFGVRNMIFMSSGMSRVPFKQFAMRDMIASLLWCLITFFLFYTLGKNFNLIYDGLRKYNLFFLILLTTIGISLFWYKRRKRSKEKV